jgi:ABC-type antimicrobial peptide transport system permease subunit
VQATFAAHLKSKLGWETVTAWNDETFGPPDWGAILQQSKDYILLAPWMSAFPGFAILWTALGLMLVGRSLQRRLDPR